MQTIAKKYGRLSAVVGGIKYDLTEMLKRPIDIIMEKAVNKHIKSYIEKDLKIIYE